MSVSSSMMGMAFPKEYARMLRKISPRPKKETKCLLRSCEKMTTHNGGFCCAEHCKEYNKK